MSPAHIVQTIWDSQFSTIRLPSYWTLLWFLSGTLRVHCHSSFYLSRLVWMNKKESYQILGVRHNSWPDQDQPVRVYHVRYGFLRKVDLCQLEISVHSKKLVLHFPILSESYGHTSLEHTGGRVVHSEKTLWILVEPEQWRTIYVLLLQETDKWHQRKKSINPHD